jgi:hypothetical protein
MMSVGIDGRVIIFDSGFLFRSKVFQQAGSALAVHLCVRSKVQVHLPLAGLAYSFVCFANTHSMAARAQVPRAREAG